MILESLLKTNKIKKINLSSFFLISIFTLFLILFPIINAYEVDKNQSYILIYDPQKIDELSGFNPTNITLCEDNTSNCGGGSTKFDIVSIITAGLDIILKFILDFFSGLFTNVISGIVKAFTKIFFWFIASFPNLSTPSIACEYNKVYSLVASLYSLAIAVVGLYWVFGATDTSKRIQAKEYTELLFFIIIAETVAPYLFNILVDLSLSLTTIFLNEDTIGKFLGTIVVGILSGAAIIVMTWGPTTPFLLLILLIMFILTLLLLFVRNLLIAIMYVLLPFSIFLYFFPLTRRVGANLLRYTVTLIFSPLILGIVLYAAIVVSEAVLGPFFYVLSVLYLIIILYLIYKILSAITLGALSEMLSNILNAQLSFPSALSMGKEAATYLIGPMGGGGSALSYLALGAKGYFARTVPRVMRSFSHIKVPMPTIKTTQKGLGVSIKEVQPFKAFERPLAERIPVLDQIQRINLSKEVKKNIEYLKRKDTEPVKKQRRK